MQNLSVQLTIPIPEDSVLITKTEYDELQKDSLKGRKFSLEELSKRTGISKKKLTEIFDKPKIKAMTDVEKGGFIAYPEVQGMPYRFLASATIDFIDNNFAMLMSL